LVRTVAGARERRALRLLLPDPRPPGAAPRPPPAPRGHAGGRPLHGQRGPPPLALLLTGRPTEIPPPSRGAAPGGPPRAPAAARRRPRPAAAAPPCRGGRGERGLPRGRGAGVG